MQNNSDTFLGNSVHKVEPMGDDVHSLIIDTVKSGFQCLVFVNNRKSTEALAGKVGKKIVALLDEGELGDLGNLQGRLTT